MDHTENSRTPIYVSYLTFANFLDWLKEMQGIPSRIDRSLWGSKFSGTKQGQADARIEVPVHLFQSPETSYHRVMVRGVRPSSSAEP